MDVPMTELLWTDKMNARLGSDKSRAFFYTKNPDTILINNKTRTVTTIGRTILVPFFITMPEPM